VRAYPRTARLAAALRLPPHIVRRGAARSRSTQPVWADGSPSGGYLGPPVPRHSTQCLRTASCADPSHTSTLGARSCRDDP